LLWGAPSLFAATLIATSFLENQWAMSPNDTLELDDFPAIIFDDDGEKHLKACAEVYIPERIAESFSEAGGGSWIIPGASSFLAACDKYEKTDGLGAVSNASTGINRLDYCKIFVYSVW
jgi:predicted component of type VI protein secretion system